MEKTIVLKKAKIDKTDNGLTIGVEIEFTYRGESKRRCLFLTKGMIEHIAVTSDQNERELMFVNDEITKAIRDNRFKPRVN